jgi:acyl-CoA synthetase (AMP-forming)/AMP-acid ligase II
VTYRLATQLRELPPQRRDAVAFVQGERELSFADLDARADRVANGARAAGLVRGDRVLLLAQNPLEIFELLIGCSRAGLVLVPVNWRLSPLELDGVAIDSTARAVIVAPDFTDTRLRLHSLGVGRALGLGLGAEYESWLAAQPDHPAEPVDDQACVVLQVYTSGTSGAPKGVLITDANLAAKVVPVRAAWGMTESSVSLVATPLFHMGAISWGLVSLYSGARTIVATSTATRDLLDHLTHERVTHTFLVPTMLGRMCEQATGADDFAALQCIAYGASPITPSVQAAALATFGADIFQLYGLTETTGGVSQLDAADHGAGDAAYLLRSAGRPYPWVELEIHGEDGRTLPAGETGEICTRSAQNCIGYFNRPDETAALLDAEGWLHTGDAGHLDADGYLFVTDRIKDMIITGGENVYPVEVETVLREHPDVQDVAVIGRVDPQWGEVVTAVVVPRPGSALLPADVLAFAEGRIAGYKRPRYVVLVDELPRNATGKVLKRSLREHWTTRDGVSA